MLTGFEVEFHADEIYYSAPLDDSRYNYYVSDVPKTGLGSSAALVTSLVQSLMNYHSLKDLNLIFRTSQYVHSLVQGKIGSGFDVASALFGSCFYTRFSKEYLDGALEREDFSLIIQPQNELYIQFDLQMGLQD